MARTKPWSPAKFTLLSIQRFCWVSRQRCSVPAIYLVPLLSQSPSHYVTSFISMHRSSRCHLSFIRCESYQYPGWLRKLVSITHKMFHRFMSCCLSYKSILDVQVPILPVYNMHTISYCTYHKPYKNHLNTLVKFTQPMGNISDLHPCGYCIKCITRERSLKK